MASAAAQEHLWTCAGPFQDCIGDHRPAVTGITPLAFPELLVEVKVVAHAG